MTSTNSKKDAGKDKGFNRGIINQKIESAPKGRQEMLIQ